MSSMHDGILELSNGGGSELLCETHIPRGMFVKNDESRVKEAMCYVQIPNTDQLMINVI